MFQVANIRLYQGDDYFAAVCPNCGRFLATVAIPLLEPTDPDQYDEHTYRDETNTAAAELFDQLDTVRVCPGCHDLISEYSSN